MTARLIVAAVIVSLAPATIVPAAILAAGIQPHSVAHPPARVVDWSDPR